MLMTTLPIFAVAVIDLDDTQAGIIVGAFAATALVLRPFIGYALDNYNRRVIMLISTLLFITALLSYAYITTLLMLVLVRMLHGASWATLNTTNYTIVPDLIPKGRRGEGIGYFSMTMPLAMVFGPAIALEIFQRNNSFDLIFGVTSVLGLLALVMFLLVKVPKGKQSRQPLRLSPSALYEKRALGISIMQFCYTFTWSSIVIFLPLYAFKNNINSSLFFILFALSVFLSRIIASKTFDTYGPSPLIFTGSCFSAAGLLILGITLSPATFAVSGFFVGIGAGLVLPSLNTMVLNIVEPSARGKANATLFTAIDLGMGVGAMVSGIIIDFTSYGTNYIISAGILCLPPVFYALYWKKHYMECVKKVQKGAEND
jgi:MFS family permease